MDELQLSKKEPHPFEHFRATVQKLVKVPKAELDEKFNAYDKQKPERRADRKPTGRKA